MRRLAVAALCGCLGCGHEANIRPVDVPQLVRVERGQSVKLTDTDGVPVEISRYKRVRLISKSGFSGNVTLRSPIRSHESGGELWLRSGSDPAIRFDPDRYSVAEVDYSDRGELAVIVVSVAIVGLAVLFVEAGPPGGR